MIVIAESGASKTDWVIINHMSSVLRFKTIGMNPIAGFDELIVLKELHKHISTDILSQIHKIYFYGAGCINKSSIAIIQTILTKFFIHTAKLEVNHDILAAARAISSREKCILGLLGTGSISAIVENHEILTKSKSMGYLISDEGSGFRIGQQVLKHVLNNTDDSLSRVWLQGGLSDPKDLISELYSRSSPNRHIAKYAKILAQIPNSPVAKNILHQSFEDYIQWHVLKLKRSAALPICFVGSIAYHFQKEVREVFDRYDLDIVEFIKNPMNGLIRYHNQVGG